MNSQSLRAKTLETNSFGQGSATSPSLGDLARQAQKDKDKTKKPTAKVLTNDDLPSGSGGASSTLGADAGRHRFGVRGVHVGYDDMRPLRRVALGNGLAQTGARSRYNRNVSLQLHERTAWVQMG